MRMTGYFVRFRTRDGHVFTRGYDAMLTRALVIISLSPYASVVDTWITDMPDPRTLAPALDRELLPLALSRVHPSAPPADDAVSLPR